MRFLAPCLIFFIKLLMFFPFVKSSYIESTLHNDKLQTAFTVQ